VERRRDNDLQLADHEIRLVKAEGKLDGLHRHHIEDKLLQRVIQLERIGGNGAVFTDAQAKRIKEYLEEAFIAFLGSDALNGRIDTRLEFNDGKKAIRVILWACGTATAISTAILLGYFGIKGH